MGTHKLIDNVKVYGLRNSFRVSKFPMQVDVNNCSEEYTKCSEALYNGNSYKYYTGSNVNSCN